MSAGPAADADETLVGRCYTKARRQPLVLGQWDGRRLWGGPYTVPQLVTAVVVAGGMVLSRGLWAHFGLFNVVPLLAVPYGASLMVRHLHVDGRNPFAAMASAAGLLTAPGEGRIAGRPLRRPRPARLAGTCSWTTPAPQPVRVAAWRAAAVDGRAGAAPDRGAVLSGAGALLAARTGSPDAGRLPGAGR